MITIVLKNSPDGIYTALVYDANMAVTFSLANFHVLPLFTVVVAPPVASYSQAPLCLKEWSPWFRVVEVFSQPMTISASV
jgi:hypothetical protein